MVRNEIDKETDGGLFSIYFSQYGLKFYLLFRIKFNGRFQPVSVNK